MVNLFRIIISTVIMLFLTLNVYPQSVEISGEVLETQAVEELLKYDYADLENNKIMTLAKIKKGLDLIRTEHPEFLLNIKYKELRVFIRGIHLIGEKTDLSSKGVLIYGNMDRVNAEKLIIDEDIIIKSLFGGLRNKDPRVRLSVTRLLLSFDLNIERQKDLIKIIDKETVDTPSYYYFIDFDLNVHLANPRFEIDLLRKYMYRKILLDKLADGEIKPEDFLVIKLDPFKVLADRIGHESSYEIPLVSFGEDKIDYLIAGLSNEISYIKQRCAEYIYIMYINPDVSDKTKKFIEKLKEKSYMLKLVFLNPEAYDTENP